MSLAFGVLLFAAITNITLGVLILFRNPRSYLGRSFFGISIFLTAWSVANYLTEQALNLPQNILFNRLAYVFGLLSTGAMYIFSYFLSKKPFPDRNRLIKICVLTSFLAGFSYTDYIAGKVIKENGELIFYVGNLILLWILAVAIMLIATIKNFRLIIKKGSARERNQAKVIAIGISLTVMFGSLTNVILPALSAEGGISTFDSAKFGPSLTFFTVSMTAYAIVRHGLFDIRAAFTKTIAYLLSILALVATYLFLLIFLITPLLHTNITATSQVMYIAFFSVFSSITFMPIKRFFDYYSRKVFYRDSYVLHDAIDAVTDRLVDVTDLENILNSSTKSISQILNSQYAKIFICRESKFHSETVFGSATKNNQSPKELNSFLRQKKGLILTDWELKSRTYNKLTRLEIGAVKKLHLQGEYEGLLLLGPKRNGSIYNSTDKSFLEIVERNVSLALDNAFKYEEIQVFTSTLERKVQDATSELNFSNSELTKLNKLKNDFISAASHQLRPQLTAARGHTELVMLDLKNVLPKRQRKNLELALESIDRMTGIVSGILETSKELEQSVYLHKSSFSLSMVVNREMKILKDQARKKKISIISSIQPGVKIFGDKQKCMEAVFNLLDNALRYTPTNGTIEVTFATELNHALLLVRDTGIGIKNSEKKNLFKKYYRSPEAKVIQPVGTGIGLYITRIFIEAHGGSVGLESTKEQEGSTFYIKLPLNK